mmetsp:Transcript_43261/g.69165  ORF Transcript_43261/g.69165 Transcript_43261/m.69165 type:complete len:309 (-) Transcript_43261:26-952(-)
MVRKSGGAAAGAMEARDKAAINKRTRANNEVTIPKVDVVPLGEFPDPPGRRLSPWTNENASGTDIIIGSVDEKGFFQGLMLTEVHMQALLRFFKMAHTYMPRDAPPQLEGLAASLKDGMATVVVTRGPYGRECDEGAGPARNSARPEIWNAVQDARIFNPSLHITCVDAPANITGAQLSKVLVPPLSAHRELAFYDGVWYVPESKEDKAAARALTEYNTFVKEKPLWHTRVNAVQDSQTQSKKLFNRKKFDWRDTTGTIYTKSWKQVYTDEDFVKPDPVKIIRDFTGPTIHNRSMQRPGLEDTAGEGE